MDNPDDIGSTLLAYETALFPRSHDAARASAHNLKMFFGNAAPDSVVNLYSSFAASDT